MSTIKEDETKILPLESKSHLLTVGESPFIKHKITVNRGTITTLLALVPTVAMAILMYGSSCAGAFVLTLLSALGTHAGVTYLCTKKLPTRWWQTVLSAVMIVLLLPPYLPWWIGPVGAAIATGVVRLAHGKGSLPFVNEALFARLLVVLIFPFLFGESLSALSTSIPTTVQGCSTFLFNALIGYSNGVIGSTSVATILVGGITLMALRIIPISTPLYFLGSVYCSFWFIQGAEFTALALLLPVVRMTTLGIPFLAFFVVSDTITTPSTKLGRALFGVGTGALSPTIPGLLFASLLTPLFTPRLRKRSKKEFANTSVPALPATTEAPDDE